MKRIAQYFKNYFILSRPLNVVIAIFSIFIASTLSPNFQLSLVVWLAAISAGFITAGANIINDIFDIEIDKINKPARLLPSGKVTVETAWIYFLFSYFTALILAGMCNWRMFSIAIIFSFLLYLYSAQFKRTILLGNFVVSLSTAFAFIFGALAVHDWMSGIFPAIFAFFFHFGREMIKDLQDVKGDLSQKAVTFAGRYGARASVIFINIIFLLLILFTIMPYIFGAYGVGYLVMVLAGVDLVLIIVSAILWTRHDPKTLGHLSHLLKLDMFVGLFAIYLGAHHVIFFDR